MLRNTPNLVILFILASLAVNQVKAQSDVTGSSANSSECYRNRKPNMCLTKFWNLAYGRKPTATNTCGMAGRERFCVQTSMQATAIQDRYCSYCSQAEQGKSHDSKYLTDFNKEGPWKTFWQSQTLYETKSRSSKFNVNITINFGIQTQVTYIRLLFQSPRPQSMAIYRRKSRDSDWEPWAYFSRRCSYQYKMPADEPIASANKYQPVCKSGFSDMVPLSGGTVLFVTLMNRLDDRDDDGFWKDGRLQDWVLASDILISLDRLNTHGDTFSPDVLYKYFYAITDITVGGRCQCNGHAAVCNTVPSTQERYCSCQHNTEGTQCEKCRKDYNDRPWRAATKENAWECRPCNCSGNSEQCVFDWDLYYRSGNTSGGRCVNCRNNTEGPHCERCLPDHRRPAPGAVGCVACNCHPVGSAHGQCNDLGRCQCKPGVVGDKCDRCQVGYYDLTAAGCKPCNCRSDGTVNNTGQCSPITGECQCKPNVEGPQCDSCRPGFFGLNAADPDGCQQCFCYGHTNSCRVHPAMAQQDTFEDFRDIARRPWGVGFLMRTAAQDAKKNLSGTPAVETFPERRISAEKIGLEPPYNELYFTLPARFLGDQSGSYNRMLRLDLSLPEEPSPDSRSGLRDVQLESRGVVFSASFDASLGGDSDRPRAGRFGLAFRLAHDPASSIWRRLSESREQFRNVLAGLTEIRVRASFSGLNGLPIFASLYNITLEGTTPRSIAAPSAPPADTMHQCDCPVGHTGPMCERCLSGYKREVPNSGRYGRCVPCECFGHSDRCDSETGKCGYVENRDETKEIRVCHHNTVGFNCERCADGYYGNASTGQMDACKKCPCPGNSPCSQEPLTGRVVCTRCPAGLAGVRCDMCALNFYGRAPDCRPCECNGNTDPNDIQVCSPDSGVCTKCIHDTGGDRCERCKNGYYGNALAPARNDCRTCGCHLEGTDLTETCNPVSGECKCRPNVDGRRCDRCQQGFFNISSGFGCESCACNYTGTGGSATCNEATGACACLSGVAGLKCDRCLPGFFNFSQRGCSPCQCNPVGIVDPAAGVCDAAGQCRCKPNIVGRKCDQCQENRYDVARGCPECPDCYGAVQQLVRDLRVEMAGVQALFNATPDVGSVGDIRARLERAKAKATELLERLRRVLGPGLDQTNLRVLQNLSRQLDEASGRLSQADSGLADAQRFVNVRFPAMRAELDRLSGAIEAAMAPIRVTLDSAGRLLAEYKTLADSINDTNRELQERLSSVRSAADELQQRSRQLEQLAQRRMAEASGLASELDAAPARLEAARGQSSRLLADAADLEALARRAEAAVAAARGNASDFTSRYNALLSQLQQPAGLGLPELAASLDSLDQLNARVLRQFDAVAAGLREAQRNLSRVVADAEVTYRAQNASQARTNEFYADLLLRFGEVQEMLDRCRAYNQSAQRLLGKLQDYDREINKSRAEAQVALQALDGIRSNLEQAENKTSQANQLYDSHSATVESVSSQTNRTEQLAQQLSDDSNSLLTNARNNLSDAMSSYEKVKAVTESLGEMDARLNNILLKQEQTDTKLMDLSALSSSAKMNAKSLQGRVDQLAGDIEKLVEISDSNPFDQQVAELNRRIDELSRNLTDGGGGSGGDAVPENQQLQQISNLVTKYQREQEELMQEIDWLEKEHARLSKVTQELGAYKDPNCWFHFAKTVT